VDGITEYPLIGADEIAAEAWAAMARQDPDGALELWQRLRLEFPARPEGHIYPVQVLWQAGRLDEADAMAAEAIARFPDEPDILVQYAWLSMVRQHWDQALKWWTRARLRAPDRLEPYVWAARALWQSGRANEAKALADEAIERFPDSLDAQVEGAWVAVARRDWEEALRCWMAVMERAPEREDAHIGAIQVLRIVGRVSEAETMASAAVVRFPNNADVMVEHVWTAVEREDWRAAAKRLDAARVQLRDSGRFQHTLGEVEYRVRSELAAETVPIVAPAAGGGAVPTGSDMSTGDLMLAFESLGERCDFGSVQRKYGVEPLGLLRFAFTKYDPLLAALEDRFAAIGTIEDTGYELYNDENIIYMRKYGLIFHTFVYQGELPTDAKRDAFRQQQRRRLAFLRDKLVSDLEDPQKFYIYSTNERISDADMRRLYEALRAYGPNSLLYVRPATENRAEGAVEAVDDGLFAGYFGGLADFVGGGQPPFELWRQLCERTYALARPAAA
jgi:tetratricopeptide (TPR) repeat protein